MHLETLLIEKSRLAQETSTYGCENCEIIDFHRFTTHGIVSLDDDKMEDSELEEDSKLIYAENVLPVVEENPSDEQHHPVLSCLLT